MATRNVFNFLAALGPAGTIAIFMEKFCRIAFDEGYNQSDPQAAPAQKLSEDAKQLRKEYVDELFEVRGRLRRDLSSATESTQQMAFTELIDVILRYRSQIARLEQSCLARQRLFYASGSLQYRRLVAKARVVDEDTLDNLTKMAYHIFDDVFQDELNKEKLQQLFEARGIQRVDIDQGTIAERISEARARELLAAWQNVLKEFNETCTDEAQRQELKEALQSDDGTKVSSTVLESLKDKLYIETNEDAQDTWMAFKHYGLMADVTKEEMAISRNLDNQV